MLTHPLPRHRPRGLPAAAVLAAALALGAAGPASADSIVFVKDHDVWLAQPDGSGQHRVTIDGTAASPWQSPSQADDGTIVAMRGGGPNGSPMVRMKQNGEVLNTISPGAMGTSIHGATAGPFRPHVSPDGRHVAFDIAQGGAVNHYYETAPDVRVVRADGSAAGQYELVGTRSTGASWLDGSRLLVGTGPVANVRPVGGSLTMWWSDYDHYRSPFPNGEDLHDGEAAPGRVAMVRGYGDGKTLQLYATDGPLSGVPAPTCTVGDPDDGPNGRRFVDPTYSPDGTGIAYQMGTGIWGFRQADPRDCDVTPTLLVPGGSEPDWGPADVNPGPRTPAAPAGPGAGGTPQAGGQGGTPQPGAQTPATRSRLTLTARRRGARVVVAGRVTTAGSCARATVRLVLTGRGATLARRSVRVGAGCRVRATLPVRGRRAAGTLRLRARVTAAPGVAASRELRLVVR